jgi:hypothetical protein
MNKRFDHIYTTKNWKEGTFCLGLDFFVLSSRQKEEQNR